MSWGRATVISLIAVAVAISVDVFGGPSFQEELSGFYFDQIITIVIMVVGMLALLGSGTLSLMLRRIGEGAFHRLESSLSRLDWREDKGQRARMLLKIGGFVFSPEVVSMVIQPTCQDLLEEYDQARAEGRPWKARWVRGRGYWSFWSAVAAQLTTSLMKRLYRLLKASR